MRIGDKAVIHTILLYWRRSHPDDKLTVVVDPHKHETHWSRFVMNDWLLSGIADELWEAEYGNEYIHRPPGNFVYREHNFCVWRRLRACAPLSSPITCDEPHLRDARLHLQMHNVTAPYVVVSPLFDAHYDKHRNVIRSWWISVIIELATRMPTVVLGDFQSMQGLDIPKAANIWKLNLCPRQSFALIQLASAFVGGETGMTLWASIFKVPVAAVYAHWDTPWYKNADKGFDTRPISFGAPVKWVPSGVHPSEVTKSVMQIMRRG